MQLHCLGTAGYHPSETRHTSCYFLPACGIVLDCGSGAFRLAGLIKTPSLDILLSHAHLDHVAGLTFLLDVLHQCQRRGAPVQSVRIWGQAKKLDAVRNCLFSELIFPAPLTCQWNAIDDLDHFQVGQADGPYGQASVSWRHQSHPGGSVAFRLDWPEATDRTNHPHADPAGPPSDDDPAGSASGKRLIYATDTVGDTSDEHAAWSAAADLLMHECYFRNSDASWARETGHSWTDRVVQIAAKSRPRRLLLTHINPIDTMDDPGELSRIQAELSGDRSVAVDLAVDKLVVKF